jgi:predicted DCC family thiol-disulfide oxidoreductase YuxK
MKDKAIIYDNNCPMCALYTEGFVKWGLMESQNRIAFSQLDQQAFIEQVDWHRAKHEIPLVDLLGGQTLYGLQALTHILSQKIPWLHTILQHKPFYSLCKGLYNFISYNRRIIIPTTRTSSTGFDCTPDFHLIYRIAFILFAILSSITITYAFGQTLNPLLASTTGGFAMLLIAGTGWVIQLFLAAILLRGERIEYISHLAAIMLIGVLLLVPAICLNWLTSSIYLPIAFLSVLLSSSLMCRQHYIRVRSLRLSQRWTVLWFIVLQTIALFWIYQLYFN